jgi:hypothetical protein
MDLELTYSAAQSKILFESTKRRRLITKGRRLGLTRGVAQAATEWLIDGTYTRMLWGDTVAGNIDRYVDRYFRPAAGELIKSGMWNWRKTDRILEIGQGTIDFRSADKPENWEGFGYDLVFLNEAGIILRTSYLWENAVQPMLLDNPDSVAIIGGTPKGLNYFYDLYKSVKNDPAWQVMNFSTYANPFLPKKEIENLEASYSSERADQEIYGRFSALTESAVYGKEMTDARREGRIGTVKHTPNLMVDTWWDIGVGHITAIWFTQDVGLDVHVIDYEQASGKGLDYFAAILQDKPYIYGRHVAPHDIKVREWGNGAQSRLKIARGLGVNFEVAPQNRIQDGIECVRQILPQCIFDAAKCAEGIEALEAYGWKWDKMRNCYSGEPDQKNWAADASDAFRIFAANHRQNSFLKPGQTKRLPGWAYKQYPAGFMGR